MTRSTIPGLFFHPRSDGRYSANWKPSPRQRRLGYRNRVIGIVSHPEAADADAVIATARALNREIAEALGEPASPEQAAPRRRTVGDAIHAFRHSAEWAALRPKTQLEYKSYLARIQQWALDGKLHLDRLDDTMCLDLRDGLLSGPSPSLHTANATFRILKLWLNWCRGPGRRWIAANPAQGIRIKAPPSREVVLTPAEVDAAAAAAEALGDPAMAAVIRLNLWMLQRAGDVRDINRMAWREIENCDPADRAVLVGLPGSPTHGKVMGFRLRQSKTGVWVDCPVPPSLHAAVEAAFVPSQWLIPASHDLTQPCHYKQFQNRMRAALDRAGLTHAQFRDLRRSGMCMLRDLGVEDSTPISGHMILGKPSILDTYMPGHTRAACAVMAHALRTKAAREALQQELADG